MYDMDEEFKIRRVDVSAAKPPPELTTAGVLADGWLEAREKTLGVAPYDHYRGQPSEH